MRVTLARLSVAALLTLVLLGFAFLAGSIALVPLLLVFGWLPFLWRTVPQMTVEPEALAVAGVAVVLLTVLLHFMARWLCNRTHREGDVPVPRWRFRSSVAVVALVLVQFVCGIMFVVAMHEIVWLLRADEPLIESSSRNIAYRMQSSNNLKQLGLAFHSYHERHGTLPPGGTFGEHGEQLHSWATFLLPYLENPTQPDMSLAWDHPANARHFRVALPVFLHPAYRERVDGAGYGLIHYAANSHVLGGNRARNFSAISDGKSKTVLAGEVNRGFKAWGHPVNWRDPAVGIRLSQDSFGGPPASRGVQFLMVDGSILFFADDTDPRVWQAVATPNGGEPVPDF